ncbi:venom allergen 5.02-like isoform X2 [Anopheles cruzii]|uniref:venom allergen 5.02-like isoform X2 n=1 Tax=Anopheles cruzii TaxID=68878 RepID=UPI0022EC7954|nr:venom allergen 5.02-like isoform X2 [Anopheles cruzii]
MIGRFIRGSRKVQPLLHIVSLVQSFWTILVISWHFSAAHGSKRTTALQFNSLDYCDTNYCPRGKTNVGCSCNFNESFGLGCIDKNPTLHRLSYTQCQQIVHKHNSMRNNLACGNVNRFAPAERMVALRWDDELQVLAECNVKNCTYAHDQCRSTERFRFAGQNIAKRTVCGRKLHFEDVVIKSLNAWFDEFRDTTPEMLNTYPEHTLKPIGHFTAMVNDNAYFLGCALLSYDVRIDVYYNETGEDCRAYYFVCNYSFNNLKAITNPTQRSWIGMIALFK